MALLCQPVARAGLDRLVGVPVILAFLSWRNSATHPLREAGQVCFFFFVLTNFFFLREERFILTPPFRNYSSILLTPNEMVSLFFSFIIHMCIQGLVHFSPMVSLLHASFSKPY
jgi:hypothetical protein